MVQPTAAAVGGRVRVIALKVTNFLWYLPSNC